MIGEWVRLCCQGPVLRRGLKYAVVVGAVLIAINQGDAIVRGNLGATNYLKMGLTVAVPFFVSVMSSAGAMRELEKKRK